MASVINTNIAATRTHNVYSRNNDYMNAAMTRVATGMKINSAKDGASTWAISEKMRERIRANDQANQNIQNDTAMLKTAQGGISNTIDILKTLKERAINAANDSNMDSDRARIATEVTQLLTQIDDNASKVKFNGRTLLDGKGGIDNSLTIEPKAATFASTTGNAAVLSLALGTASTDKLTDLGFAKGDVIKFSWKADGTADTKSYSVTENSTVADLAFNQGKLSVSYLDSGNPITDRSSTAITPTSNATTAGLYAVGDANAKITDFKVAVTDSEGSTNSTAQTAMVFSGLQQSADSKASHTVMTVSLSSLKDDNNAAATTATKLKELTTDGSTAIMANTNVIQLSWNEDGSAKTDSLTVGNATLADLIQKAGLTLVTGDGNALALSGTNVKDATDASITTTSGTIYAVGAAGKAIENLTFKVETSSADDTEVTAASTALNGLLTSVQTAAKVSTNTDDSTTSGTNTALTFHIGGEQALTMDVDIKAMTVGNLFSGYTASTFSDLFKNRDSADTAMGLIDTALTNALNEQTKLGAYETRLGYASDNITTMNENLEAADSVMRDSDIAKEMTSYMKYAVLSQASQYMLAQAGQNAFQVLNLLQQ